MKILADDIDVGSEQGHLNITVMLASIICSSFLLFDVLSFSTS